MTEIGTRCDEFRGSIVEHAQNDKKGCLLVPVPKITLVMIRTVSMPLSQLVNNGRKYGLQAGMEQSELTTFTSYTARHRLHY